MCYTEEQVPTKEKKKCNRMAVDSSPVRVELIRSGIESLICEQRIMKEKLYF